VRDFFIIVIFSVWAIYALKRPYYGALLWVWIGLMNPHRLGWGFAYSLPFAMIAAMMTMLSIIINPKDFKWPQGLPVVILILFTLWMGITTNSAIHPDPSLNKYIDVLKVLLMTMVVGSVVRTREDIFSLIWIIILSIGYFGFKGGIFTIITGGSFRVWGPPSSLVEGNNELAVALTMIIPLMYFMVKNTHIVAKLFFFKKFPLNWIKMGIYLVIFLCAVSVIGSHSRGAFLAIIGMLSMLWWRSGAKFSVGFLLILVAPLVIFLMPDEWMNRMNTIETYEEDASAMGRINAWKMAINIANDRFLGAGFSTASRAVYEMYAPNPNDVLVAHSIYFQVLGEHGYIGLVLYLLFWLSTYIIAGQLVHLAKGNGNLEWAGLLGSMCKVSLVGFAIGGAFLSLAYWDMPYYIMIILVCTEHLVKEQLAMHQSNQTTSDEC